MFAEWYGPPPRLFVYGAVDTAEALVRGGEAARLDGDRRRRARDVPHPASASRSADQLIAKWPEEAIAEVAPDHQTAIVVLTHDDKFDEPALKAALETEAFYVGALGSRRNQERRRERLLEAGVAEEQLDRIMGPCGLDIGADTPGGDGALDPRPRSSPCAPAAADGPLREAKQRIHVEVLVGRGLSAVLRACQS